MILFTIQIASVRNLERLLAIAGAAVCLVVSVRAWLVLSAEQPMWPLPDVYLFETAVAGLAGMWAIISSTPTQAALRGRLVWAVVGVLVAFVILGALSIGFLYAPAAVCFILAAFLSDKRQNQNTAIHLGIGVLAALAQGTLMFALIALLARGAGVGPSGVPGATAGDGGASATQTAVAPNQTLAPCLVTQPNGETPPGENSSPTFYGNGSIWTDLSAEGKVIFRTAGSSSSLDLKWPWWLSPTGKLTIQGRRLDALAAPLSAEIPPKVDISSLQMSILTFPTPGCWEITGRSGQTSLTFVTQVIYIREP